MLRSHFKTFVKGFYLGNKSWKKVVKWSFPNCNNCIMLRSVNLFANGLRDFYFQEVLIYKYGIPFNGQGKHPCCICYISVILVNFSGKWMNCVDVVELFVKSPYLQFFFRPPFTPYSMFQWYLQSNEILLNLKMKCWNLAFNAQGSRIIVIIQVRVEKTYVVGGGVQEKGKTWWNSVYHQNWWFFEFHPHNSSLLKLELKTIENIR
jgi:hypothetical protein